jgi:hypothetical protein
MAGWSGVDWTLEALRAILGVIDLALIGDAMKIKLGIFLSVLKELSQILAGCSEFGG